MLIFVQVYTITNYLMTKTAIIVAGGKGERMQTTVPKQFLEIKGKPILMRTLEAFRNYDNNTQLILVLPSIQIDFWKQLCKKHAFNIEHLIVEGGGTRFQSVKNGLAVVDGQSVVAVHDGVRPLVSNDTISRCFDSAEKYHAVIPVVDLIDSIRETDETGNRAVDRNKYKLVQTPQVFLGSVLKKAYEQEFSSLFTDDASVVEMAGTKVLLVEGNRENIKVTTEIDLKIAEALLNN